MNKEGKKKKEQYLCLHQRAAKAYQPLASWHVDTLSFILRGSFQDTKEGAVTYHLEMAQKLLGASEQLSKEVKASVLILINNVTAH